MEKLNLTGVSKAYSFYTIPTELLNNPVFDDIDYGSKLLYGMMLSYASLSATNSEFIDDDGNVYIVYTVEQVMKNMRCSEQTTIKMLKQLNDKGLVEKKHRGHGKPPILYIKNIYLICQ
jgi:hypothetical protein